MLELILFSLFLPLSSADLAPVEFPNMPPENYVPMDNMIAGTLWAMGVCSCVGIVCNHKKKVPIKVEPCEHDDYYETKNYYKIQIHDKQKPNKHKLNKLKNDLKEMMNAIKSLEDEIEEEEQEKCKKENKKKSFDYIDYINLQKDKFNKENNISMDIPENIKYKFGKGQISFKQNEKYYHGVNQSYYSSAAGAWDKTGNWTKDHIGCMFHYTNQNKKLPNPELDTHKIEEFCLDCSYCTDKNKKKRKIFIYKCNGHEI